MRFLSLFLAVILGSAFLCAGQMSQAPSKIATLSDSADIRAFQKQLNRLVSELKKRPDTTGGFVAISGRNYDELDLRYDAAKNFMKRHPEMKLRLEFSRRGTAYDKEWSQTEFWIVPECDKPPYWALTYDCICPTTEITGPPTFANANTSTLEYMANVSGGTASYISYRWKVSGGKIVSGQNTPSIVVQRNSTRRESVSVELDIKLDEDCFCVKHFTFLTVAVPKASPGL